MNVKLKKHGKIALFSASLLIIGLLVVSCPVPVFNFGNIDNADSNGEYTPPDGMGYVRINLASSLERTIMPVVAVTNLLSFRLEFTDTDTVVQNDFVKTFTRADLTTNQITIELDEGIYTLKAIAYAANDYTLPIAEWEYDDNGDKDIEIEAGAGNTITLNFALFNPVTAAVDGTFAWAIDLSNVNGLDINESKLTIAAITGGGGTTPGTAEYALTDSNNTNTGVALLPGYYEVVIHLEREYDLAEGNPHRAIFNQVHALQVYQNLTSSFTPAAIEDTSFRAVPYTLTFDMNDTIIAAGVGGSGASATDPIIVRIPPGGTMFSLPAVGNTLFPVTDWEAQGYKFHGWFENQEDPGNITPADLGDEFLVSTQVFGTTTVYAAWEFEATSGVFTVTLDPIDNMGSPTPVSIVFGTTTTINANLGDLTTPGLTFAWSMINKEDGSTIDLGTTQNLNIATGAGTRFNEIPTTGNPVVYDITLRVTVTATLAEYSAQVTLTVTAP